MSDENTTNEDTTQPQPEPETEPETESRADEQPEAETESEPETEAEDRPRSREARYRIRAKQAEAERDQLRSTLTAARRSLIAVVQGERSTRISTRMDPQAARDLLDTLPDEQIDALFDADGRVDMDALEKFNAEQVKARPYLSERRVIVPGVGMSPDRGKADRKNWRTAF